MQNEEMLIRSFYKCPYCDYEWDDVWDCACNDECGECGASDIEPYEWEEIDDYDIENDSRMSGDPEFDKYKN